MLEIHNTAEAGMQISLADDSVWNGNTDKTLWLSGVGRSEDFLREGQIVRGEVIFATDETANVRIENGTVLRARLSNGVELAEGDTVFLSVRGNSGESLVLQLVADRFAGTSPEQSAAGALMKAGLQSTPMNLSVAEALKEAGFPVERDTVERAAAILSAFTDAEPGAAAFAAANRLEAGSKILGVVGDLQRSAFRADEIITRIFSLLAESSGFAADEGLPASAAEPGEGNITIFNATGKNARGEQQIPYESAEQNLKPGEKYGPGTGDVFDGFEPFTSKRFLKSGAGFTSREQWRSALKAAERSYFTEVKGPEDAEALKKAGEEMLGRLEILNKAANTVQNGDKRAAKESERLISGLKLLQRLDRCSCMQIPVIIGGRPRTLAVCRFRKNEGERKKAAGATTFLIAINTQNLGPVEALVRLRDGQYSIRFSVTDEAVAEYLRSRTTALYQMVNITGYRLLGTEVRTVKKPTALTNVLKAVEDTGERREINIRI